jgi:hypothetical protein
LPAPFSGPAATLARMIYGIDDKGLAVTFADVVQHRDAHLT